MAFCTNCGAKLADDAKFCTECGAKVEPLPSEPVTEPVTEPATTPASASGAAPANDYTRPVSDYTYTPPSNGYNLYPDRAKHRLFRLILAGNTTQYLFL